MKLFNGFERGAGIVAYESSENHHPWWARRIDQL